MGGGGSRSRGSTDDSEETPEPSSNPLTQGYEDLVNAIIRPPRMEYTARDLGPATFSVYGRHFARQDFEVENSRGLKVACSWWKFKPEDAPAAQLPCVIYLHGNASCRIAAFELLRHLLPLSISVLAIDFAGSGLSGGEYVSLGYYEKEDVECVVKHLRESGEVSTLGLWGHSMGAATALLYADRDPSIAGMVVDSSFADLGQLINELGQNLKEQGPRLPGVGIVISVAVRAIRRSVSKKAKFDPKDVSPIKNGDKAFIPTLFAHGKDDAFIKPHHTEQLYNNYSGDKELVLFDGDHNSPRPESLFSRAVTFLYQRLGVQAEHCLDIGSPMNGTPFDRSTFSGGAAAVRQAEAEMMRQAMMASLHDSSSSRGERTGSGEAATTTEVVHRIPPEELTQGIEQFRAVTGVDQRTARYYVEASLATGGSVEMATNRYFECDCAPAPNEYQPPALS
mmetsp:Transcript_29946/g.64752  ORF Transcript_29946/g.64752 Transcript_29946/m.64752 type:complete len:452 (-) Transcript_29946:20-1375(-)|eukprot:CAMPEP_0206433194 /NCGR_PEP_ID=MMETSP0324_2-20121206/8389_1 /ASSEMBLY_ACC=CAM_ASM_000836 /TAXON_ID=2866 /ORGANISM="Crypthecodinium cohnii, Strain Seligo" /LENGTH=451 /DNA_ID=CAMNT_0053899415 /DNA_START=77 /DNA_END=1432 /DNA_ORIENTATION=+